MANRDGESPRNSREIEPETADSLRAARRKRIAKLRSAHANEKVLIAFILVAAIGGSLLYINTLHIPTEKSVGGLTLVCFVAPTIVMFALYEPVKKLIRRTRGLFDRAKAVSSEQLPRE